MKLLIFVDVHTSLKVLKRLKAKVKKEKPDLILCAGDISIFEQGIEYVMFFLNKLKKSQSELKKLINFNLFNEFLIKQYIN